MSYKYGKETFLDMIELYSAEVGNIASEHELSNLFDRCTLPNTLQECADEAARGGSYVNLKTKIALSFENLKYTLHREGAIHFEQLKNYEYIGAWS